MVTIIGRIFMSITKKWEVLKYCIKRIWSRVLQTQIERRIHWLLVKNIRNGSVVKYVIDLT